MPATPHILVVDDDARLRALLTRYLASEGFLVTAAGSAAEARAHLRMMHPDLLVLDVMMPTEDGLELTRSLRADGADPPILLLTARGAPEDRIAGFEAGADDYLAKPFEPRELALRIHAMLRRAAPTPSAAAPLRLGALSFDAARAELAGPAGPVHLTSSERALLCALADNAGQTLSREALAESLGMDDSSERAIDVQITRLRRKLEPDPREPRFLHTVRGRGYMLMPGH